MAIIRNLMRVTRCVANSTGRREVAIERTRISRGPALDGIWKATINPARNLFLGFHHSPAPFHQSASDGADLFQSKTPFVAASHDQEESTKGHAACAEKLSIRSISS